MIPNEEIASSVVLMMTKENVISVSRMTTGDQYFVFEVKTINTDYVIRMTDKRHSDKFLSAMYWQERLLPLGIPLAKFIQSDLDEKYSPFPALLMPRLPGDDLCNVYTNLTDFTKRNLAKEMITIQSKTDALPIGNSFGIIDTYEKSSIDKTWFDFIFNRLQLFKRIIKEAKIFDIENIEKVITLAKNLQSEFDKVAARPFLWDASERNVIIHKGKISGIVDVDDMCFGDPLFVIGLTSAALENDGYDTLYPDYWSEALHLDNPSQHRLAFYCLFFTIVFMRKHSIITSNNRKIAYNIERLNKNFQKNLKIVNEF